MNTGMMINTSYNTKSYIKNDVRTTKTEQAETVTFNTRIGGKAKNGYKNAVADYKKRHPENASKADDWVRAGKKVLEKNNAVNVDRDSMTMEEYKQFFTELMDSIPYDISQQRDVNIWSITEEGWEQMKNDPDYEAWVLGYTSLDRAVHNPWAAMPGYSPEVHTEHFGASIDEHIGQGFPINSSPDKAKSLGSDDGESWWEKRNKRIKEILAQQVQESLERRQQLSAQAMQALWQEGTKGSDAYFGNMLSSVMSAAIAAYDASILSGDNLK